MSGKDLGDNSKRPRPWSHPLAVVVVLCVAAAVWSGSDRRPADWSQPLRVHVPASSSASEQWLPPTFRVASLNMHGGRDQSGNNRLDQLPQLLSGYQLVALNEVHAAGWPWSRSSQAETLGQRLGMVSVFAPTERRWWHDTFGNALLCRGRPVALHVVPLPCTQGKKYRNALLAQFRSGGRRLLVLVTHVDTRVDHDRQLKAVLELFLSLEPPVVLAGDLNTVASNDTLRTVLSRPDVVDAVAAGRPPPSASRRIDWILVRGLTVVTGGVVTNELSDHPLVWAELSFPADRPPSASSGSAPVQAASATDATGG